MQYELLHTELARKQIRLMDGTIESASFSDHDVHEVLDRSGYDVHRFYDTDRDSEWYKVPLQPAIAAIKTVKQGRNVLTAAEKSEGVSSTSIVAEPTVSMPIKPKIILRDEQRDCIEKTQKMFLRSDRMLWDCKRRFGKTITAYSLVKKMGYKKVLVVTHPVTTIHMQICQSFAYAPSICGIRWKRPIAMRMRTSLSTSVSSSVHGRAIRRGISVLFPLE